MNKKPRRRTTTAVTRTPAEREAQHEARRLRGLRDQQRKIVALSRAVIRAAREANRAKLAMLDDLIGHSDRVLVERRLYEALTLEVERYRHQLIVAGIPPETGTEARTDARG